MARPVEFNKDKAARIVEALRIGNTRKVSASAGGVCYPTMLEHLKRDPDFAEAVARAEDEAEAAAVKVVRAAMLDTWQAGAWWLERRRPQLYGKQEKLHVLRDVARDITALSDEELEQLAYGDEGEGAG